MSVNDIYAYIFDFLSFVFENKELSNHIKRVILFGSVASGEFDKNSDIDIFFDVKGDKTKIEPELNNTLKSFEIKSEKTWKLKNISLPIKNVVGDIEEEKWAELKEEMISNGILLYGKFESMPKKMGHYVLINYSLENLTRKKKMKLIRELYGYELKKGKKTYRQDGLLKKSNGYKLGTNVILIPINELRAFKELFKSFKLGLNMREIWTKI